MLDPYHQVSWLTSGGRILEGGEVLEPLTKRQTCLLPVFIVDKAELNVCDAPPRNSNGEL
jgi:hypothetical protein